MSKTNSFETDFLKLIFNNDGIANIGDATGLIASTLDGDLWVRLCDTSTCDDSTLGTEVTYTGYVAGGISVARTTGGWTVSGNNVTNVAAITYGYCSGGTDTGRFFEIWKTQGGTLDTDRLFWGQLTSDIAIATGVTPTFAAGALDVNED